MAGGKGQEASALTLPARRTREVSLYLRWFLDYRLGQNLGMQMQENKDRCPVHAPLPLETNVGKG